MTFRLKSLLLPFVLAAALSACDSGNKQAEEAGAPTDAPTEVTTEATPEGTPDNTQEVLDYYAAHSEFFKFASAEDLPADLTWEDGSELADIGSPDAKKGGTYHARVQDFPRTLRIVGPDSNGSFRPFILDYVRPQFADRHPSEFKLYPGIAKEWSVSVEDKTVYVRINPDARWSDGEKITTEDVLFGFFFYRSKYIVAPWYNDFYTNTYSALTIYDDLTFALTFPEAKPDMDSRALEWSPQPRHFFIELGDDYVERYQWRFVPTPGPYVVLDKDIKKGRSIAISRLDDWWAKDNKFYRNRFNYDKMRFSVIRDTPKAFEAFKHGELEAFGLQLSEYWYDKLPDSDADVQAGYMHKAFFNNVRPRPTYGLWINEAKPFLDNQDIRVGINYATNWDMVIARFYRGDATRMRTTADGYGPFSHPTLQARPFDTEKALEYFAKAGFTKRNSEGILINEQGQKLSFTLSTGYEALKDILTILREEGLKAGIEFRLEVLDGTAGWKKVQEKKHDIHFSAFGVSLELYPRYWETYASVNAYDVPYLEDGTVNPERQLKTQTNNLQVIADPELDALIEQYRHNDDVEDMKRLSFKMEEMLHEDASFVPGFVLPFYRVAHWRWMRFPEGFDEKHSSAPNRYFVPWIDEDIKAETKAAMKSGETFPVEINVYDQFKED